MNQRSPTRVVFDTNVLVAAVRSRQGASFALIRSIPSPDFRPCLSVGLYMEYQDALLRPENLPQRRTATDGIAFLRYFASQSHLQEIYYLWRPVLPDPNDDMILELELAAACERIITYNVADFRGTDRFGISVVTPGAFLKLLRERS